MKKLLAALLASILIAIVLFMCSCVNVETRRFATIDQPKGTIHLEVSGFNSSPLTPEGPFPRWSNRLDVTLKPGAEIPQAGKREFSAGADFSTQYDQVESGTILVDRDARQVEVKVKYTHSYWWSRVLGRFPIQSP